MGGGASPLPTPTGGNPPILLTPTMYHQFGGYGGGGCQRSTPTTDSPYWPLATHTHSHRMPHRQPPVPPVSMPKKEDKEEVFMQETCLGRVKLRGMSAP